MMGLSHSPPPLRSFLWGLALTGVERRGKKLQLFLPEIPVVPSTAQPTEELRRRRLS